MYKLATIFLLLLAASALRADFESAAEAYRNNDYPRAFAEFKRLAANGNPQAQTALALMYKFGEAVERDPETSFKWYQKAANAGYPPAQFNLGMMYLEGFGTERDEQTAMDWLSRAAEAGFERARTKLAELDQRHILSRDRDRQTPSSWSRAWNFRLPNDIRNGKPGNNEKYQVQLGAMDSRQAANYLWERLQAESGALFTGLNPRIERPDGRSLYKVRTGPFANFEEAESFCHKLVQQNRDAACYPLPVD